MSEAQPIHYYYEGQVWRYQTRPNEETSTVLINKIEYHTRLGAIFHISIAGVQIKNPRSSEPISQFPHFPVAAITLEQSLTELVDSQISNPDYREGYASWREAFDAGKAGIFTIPVAHIITVVEETINQG